MPHDTLTEIPQTEDNAWKCVHDIRVWFGHECGMCMDEHGTFIRAIEREIK